MSIHQITVFVKMIIIGIYYFGSMCFSQTMIWEKLSFPGPVKFSTITTDKTGAIFVGTYANGAFRSLDNGITWDPIFIDSSKYYIDYITPGRHGDLLVSTGGRLYLSAENGSHWMLLKTDPSIKKISKIVFDSQDNLYFCGATALAGIVYRSTDNGASWTNLLNTTTFGWIRDIAVDSHNNIFIIGGYDILSSNDGGNTWNRLIGVSANITQGVAYSISIDRDDVIYVATSIGIMRSNNSGLNWSWNNFGLSSTFVTSIIASRSGIVIASTDGGINVSTNKADGWYLLNSGILNQPFEIICAERIDGTLLAATIDGTLYRSFKQTTRFMVSSRFRRAFAGSNGTFAIDSIVVTNQSNGPLSISSITTTIPHCLIVPNSATISGGDSCTFGIQVTSASSSLLDGVITFNSNSFMNYDTLWVQLFVGVPFLQPSVHFVDFGRVHRKDKKDIYFTIVNPGYDTLKVGSEILPNQHFQIIPPSFEIPPRESKELSLRFIADSTNPLGGTDVSSSILKLSSNSPLSPEVLYLSGISYGLLNVKYMEAVSEDFVLEQNYPNPFNPTTTIKFAIPGKLLTTLKIFDCLGRDVETLVSDELSPGHYSISWNASTRTSGIYFYSLRAGRIAQTRKLLLVK